jgi:succinoglycan biosynthesis protein ExoM
MLSRPMLRVVSESSADRHGDERASIVVAVLTFRRPRQLAECLQGCARVVSPPQSDVALLVIDNDAQGSGRATVDAHRELFPALYYCSEPRTGIPVARNRALHEALIRGADALCFIDDDEVPEPDWLVNLVGEWRQSSADLVGGPVGVAPVPLTATPWQRLLNASLADRSRRKYARTAQAAASGGRYTIVTNNWLCDLRWLAASGQRFDERLLFTGGSDTDFFRAAIVAGCRCAWAPAAVVCEVIRPNRLTLRYQMWRGASQSMAHFQMKHEGITPRVAVATLAICLVRAMLAILLLAVPVFGIGSLVIGIRSLGWAAGRIQSLLGMRSQLYACAAAHPEEKGAPPSLERRLAA